ncbi:MAG: peptidase S41, partial [Muribaculaceae bacterium]|nr:peptidase S41 [Muribaculaceae bacterium]
MKNRMLLTAAVAFTAFAAYPINPLWVRDVKISPDGQKIAFSYKGDIYSVPSNGGEATRLTFNPSYESSPIWSPDGKLIAFSSDRNGSMDLYIMPANGGAEKRLTYNSGSEMAEAFSPDGKEIYFSSVIQDPAISPSFPTGRLTELYAISTDGSNLHQVLPTPATSLTVLPDGKILYEDVKGMEDKWRKHHTSSVTRDIWIFDPTTGKHTNLTDHAGEDRSPAASRNGNLYFLSERDGGSFNVYAMPLNSPKSTPKAITDFKNHPVRFLSISNDDKMAFTYNGELYTMNAGGQPTPLSITVTDDSADEPVNVAVSSVDEALPSPDGKQVAFINRGEVFVTSTEYPSVKQITHTPALESNLSWGSDGRTLYYSSLRNGKSNIYKATIARKDDPNFSNATLIEETALFPDDGQERGYAQISPDGKKMAFVENRNNLKVMDLGTKSVKALDGGRISNYRSGGFPVYWA